jgi:hypothetical protein
MKRPLIQYTDEFHMAERVLFLQPRIEIITSLLTKNSTGRTMYITFRTCSKWGFFVFQNESKALFK